MGEEGVQQVSPVRSWCELPDSNISQTALGAHRQELGDRKYGLSTDPALLKENPPEYTCSGFPCGGL